MKLPLLAGDLCFSALSPALPLWYINLPLFMSTINIEYSIKNKTDLVWDLAPFSSELEFFLFAVLIFEEIFFLFAVPFAVITSYNVLSLSIGGWVNFSGGGWGGKKRQSPDFKSPEVGISVYKWQYLKDNYDIVIFFSAQNHHSPHSTEVLMTT